MTPTAAAPLQCLSAEARPAEACRAVCCGIPRPTIAATAALVVGVLTAALLAAPPAAAQSLEQRGFLELKGLWYPEATPADDTKAIGEVLFRYEPAWRPTPWLRLAGSLDLRDDTHDQTEWNGFDVDDRSTRRPGLSLRRLDATLSRGPLTLQLGKQFIRWGKADILNPTDRFAPRDFLSVVDTELLAVTAARFTVGLHADSLDVAVSRFTPSRTPLIDQRWSGLPAEALAVPITDAGAVYPDRPQIGVRWNHVGRGVEFSLSAFSGNNHLPLVDTVVWPPIVPLPGLTPGVVITSPSATITRVYPQIWMAGGDVAWPLRWFTVKGEAAFFGAPADDTDEYWLYVIQLERQSGEWLFVGGYAGEYVTERRQPAAFAPDRGLTKAFLGRASYTIDTNRSLAFEGAVRQNGDGVWTRGEYSQAFGQHLRLTLRGTLIAGAEDDFLGQYRDNSNITAYLRYSF